MKRITRDRRLTPEEAAKYKAIRQEVDAELPDLIARHHERVAGHDQLHDLLLQLKAAREEQGLSLADVTERTGMDRSALSKLETGQRPTPRSIRWCATPTPQASAWSSRWRMSDEIAGRGVPGRRTWGRFPNLPVPYPTAPASHPFAEWGFFESRPYYA
jgi:hypothetical protein